jgi:UDP-2-acetamido-2-deoxy-ribo-hexuluronate aminotransferase
MEKIKMVDLQTQYNRIKSEIDQAIQQTLQDAQFIQGPQVKAFADALQRYTGADHVITCANGTDALQIAMMALGLKPGDEVILPVHTYVATAEVIALLGLTPVFVDVDKHTFTLDIEQVESCINENTMAIVPVHLYGQCADMEPLIDIAEKNNLTIIEDTAQALGAMYTFSDGSTKQAGTMGELGCTSFFPSKNLGCYGDGGALFTTNAFQAEKLRMIANHGQRVKYQHDIVGVNSRLDTLQAAILNVKIKYLNDYTERRRAVAQQYDEQLQGIDRLITPHRAPYSTHVFHQYTIQVPETKRDVLKTHLEEKGIPSMIYYPIPLHLQRAYRREGIGEGSFPVTEKLSRTVLSLPIHTEMTPDEVSYISDTIRKFFQHG